VAALGNLPRRDPARTEHVGEMIVMIEELIAAGHAYAADGHVLFDVSSKADYGKLARRSLTRCWPARGWKWRLTRRRPWTLCCGSRPKRTCRLGFSFRRGAPAGISNAARWPENIWRDFRHHMAAASIWCSHIMKMKSPRARVRIAAPDREIWMHNGFLEAKARRCHKSTGNFFTYRELLATGRVEVLRFNMLRTTIASRSISRCRSERKLKTLERWYDVTEPLANPAPNTEFF